MRKHLPLICLLPALLLVSCSTVKYVPDGRYLLDEVKVVSYDDYIEGLNMQEYVKQNPNSKWFNLIKLPLYTYSMSGRDTTRWMNRFLRRMGEAPVIYDESAQQRTRASLLQKMQSEGYLKANVGTRETTRNKRLNLYYFLNSGPRYTVDRVSRHIQDSALARLIGRADNASLLHVGMPFSTSLLNKERERITVLLKNAGYYKFSKDYITFAADTAYHSTKVGLTMNIAGYKSSAHEKGGPYPLYKFNQVYFLSNVGVRSDEAALKSCDTLSIPPYLVLHKEKLFLRPALLTGHTSLVPGETYSDRAVERTYRSFAALSALKYTNIRFEELPGEPLLNAYIQFERSLQRSVGVEVEGTNTAGDLGAAATLSFTDKNLFHGSESFTIKLRGAYEAISGLEGYTGDSYYEYGAEATLKFPGLIVPFASSRYNKRLAAVTSQIGLQFNSQERPEFERQVLSASWSYGWESGNRFTHKLDVLDVNYIHVPWISDTFKHDYLDSISNSILRYNYENMLITKFGYSMSYNTPLAAGGATRRTSVAVHTNIETSGNVLNLFSAVTGRSKDSEGQYTVFNIAFAQYVKGDLDVTTTFVIDRKNSLLFHLGVGAAYPYGNSTILPFEKRYFSGGANSLRGWSVRSLGPGSFKSSDRSIDFINQSGDFKLDFNLEYRTHLFWKINTAAFVDAGNIWTFRSYDEQPGGEFKMNRFYKEIAASYGLGIRLELGFFILRFDGGMKAVNPAYTGRDKYPLLHPSLSRDFALHFAVGYPF